MKVKVLDNKDPLKMGRVLVNIDSLSSAWLMPLVNDYKSGLISVPEINSMVEMYTAATSCTEKYYLAGEI
jgi:hypothetical protein